MALCNFFTKWICSTFKIEASYDRSNCIIGIIKIQTVLLAISGTVTVVMMSDVTLINCELRVRNFEKVRIFFLLFKWCNVNVTKMCDVFIFDKFWIYLLFGYNHLGVMLVVKAEMNNLHAIVITYFTYHFYIRTTLWQYLRVISSSWKHT